MKNRLPMLKILPALGLVVVFGNGCSNNTKGDEAAPVYLTVAFDSQSITRYKNVGDGTLLAADQMTVTGFLKVPGNGGSPFNNVQLDAYVVEWKRTDGGTKTPATERFDSSIIVPVPGVSNMKNFPFMSLPAVQAAPFDQLFPFNGGLDRETRRTEIDCTATVTVIGHTISGSPVSAVGQFPITFYYRAPAAKVNP